MIKIIIMISIICSQLLLSGCETIVHVDDLSNNQTKSEIMQSMGKPIKIYTDASNLKYGADELWIYRDYQGHGEDYLFYFKNGVVIKSESKSYATL